MDERVASLIPFYLNRTLAPEEEEAVEAALLKDNVMREEFFRWLEVKRGFDAAGRAFGEAGASGDPARFAAKLRKRSTLYIPLRRASARYLRIPAWAWQPAAVLIVALQIVALGLFIAGIHLDQKEGYRGLSVSGAAAAEAVQTYNVIFEPEATEREIRTLLLAYRAQFAEGPNRIGLYRVRFTDPDPEKLERFQREPIVQFMERNL